MFLPLLHQKARGKPDMEVNKLWAHGMISIKEQGDLLKTLAHQATQSGMLTRMVFSRVEIWWIDGSWNRETCLWTTTRFVHRAHGQIYCWRQWHGLWHRNRIGHFVKITIILAESQWPIAVDIGPIFKRCKERHRQTFFHLVNVHVFDIGSICIHGKELLRKFTFHQKIQGTISQWNRCSTYLKSW